MKKIFLAACLVGLSFASIQAKTSKKASTPAKK